MSVRTVKYPEAKLMFCQYGHTVNYEVVFNFLEELGNAVMSHQLLLIDAAAVREIHLQTTEMVRLSTFWSSKLPYKPKTPVKSAWVNCSAEVLNLLSLWKMFFREDQPAVEIQVFDSYESALDWLEICEHHLDPPLPKITVAKAA